MTEKFALHQRFGDRTAVHRHKRLSGSSTEIVNGAGKDFFARSRFSTNENGASHAAMRGSFFTSDEQSGALANDILEADARLNTGTQAGLRHAPDATFGASEARGPLHDKAARESPRRRARAPQKFRQR